MRGAGDETLRRWAVAAVLLLLVGVGCQQQSGAAQRGRSLSGFVPGEPGRLGADYRIDVPGHWNGTVILYSHGTIVPPSGNRRLISIPIEGAPDAGTQQWLLAHGYGLAASAYATPTGWAVEDALHDQLRLLDYFRKAVGRPRRTIAWGDSQGGLDTALLLERYTRDFAGGMSLCGLLGGGIDYFNHDLDMFFALDRLLAPGVLIHPGAPTRAGIDSGPAPGVIDAAQAAAAGRARLALTAAIEGFPVRFQPGDPEPAPGDWEADEAAQVQWIRFALGTSFRQDVERRAHGNPSWNTGVDYSSLVRESPWVAEVTALYQQAGLDLDADLASLAAAPRVSAEPWAVQYMMQFGEPSGKLRLPFLTMHTIDDGRVLAGNERAFAGLVGNHGSIGDLRQLFAARAGHCAFSDSEIIAGFQVLVARLDSGRWPDTSSSAMNHWAARVGGRYAKLAPLTYSISGPARFTRYTPPAVPR